MGESGRDCLIAGIPNRLHTGNKTALKSVSADDWLFMRHEPLGHGEPYGFEVPGHQHLEDQSVNSEKINGPEGNPRDVLFDTRRGQHYSGYQIACFGVSEVVGLEIPNENTVRCARDGRHLMSPTSSHSKSSIGQIPACIHTASFEH
jgi:hypothetical protein